MIAMKTIDVATIATCGIEPLLADQPVARWLSPGEQAEIGAARHLQARRQRLAGRILAKMLVQRQLASEPGSAICDPRQIQIDSRDGMGRRVAPRILVSGRWLDWSVSISHGESVVAAALSTEGTRPVGIDVTDLTGGQQESLSLWLTEAERRIAAEAGPDAAVRLWCLKEAAFKALGEGRRFRPLDWDVSRCAERLSELVVHGAQSRGTSFDRTADEPGLPCGPAPATRPATRQFTCAASVRLRTAQGWLTRPVDVHTWSCGETLVCLVRTATGSGTADTLDVETPRPQAHELCGC